MKIKSVKTYKKDLALQKPYTIARETISAVENVFFEITHTEEISCGDTPVDGLII